MNAVYVILFSLIIMKHVVVVQMNALIILILKIFLMMGLAYFLFQL